MRECTTCGATWRGEPSLCPLDGGSLRQLPDPLIGRTIAARYVVTEKIGAGGMATVYRARHETADRDVAIKFLAPEMAVEINDRKRFLREARAANRIDHEHIIDITDFGETEDGLVYLVMEYLQGQTLADLIHQGPLPGWRAVALAIQMTSALARAHDLDVIHRDIKPDNIFVLNVDGDDFLKLLDFGLAKIGGEARLTATGAVFGTPDYMAPEQARGGALTASADLYALGCVIYDMLVGEPPFTGSTPELILKHIREPAPWPSDRNPDVAPELDALVLRLLSKDPSARHADGHHLLEELRGLAELVPSLSPPPRTVPAPPPDTGSEDRKATVVSNQAAPEAWKKRVDFLAELVRRAHPKEKVAWVEEALDGLHMWVVELTRVRSQLLLSASALLREEDLIRESRLRFGPAIDELARDESRCSRRAEEQRQSLQSRLSEASAVTAGLVRAWCALPGLPRANTSPDPSSVHSLVEIGERAKEWENVRSQIDELSVAESRTRYRLDDLHFQIEQLKDRLGSLTEEGEMKLSTLRQHTQALDRSSAALVDRIARRCERLSQHLMSFDGIGERLRDFPN